MSLWSDLPDDLLILIGKKVISDSDFMSFSQVCSSWRSIAKQDRKRFPLQGILTKQRFMLQRNPFEFPQKLKGWPTLSLPIENVVCGSHQGWIVVRKNYPHKELVLINPVIQVQFKLPFTYDTRVIFSANPMDYNCYCIITDPRGPLRCCKLGDMGWTVVQISGQKKQSLGFMDSIYYRGKLYAMRVSGKLFVCDDITASPPMMTKLMNTPQCLPAADEWVLRRIATSPRFFVVESGQELLLVCRKGICMLSEGFEVYRLDLGGLRWGRVRNLGEHSLFLGKNQSFSLSESDGRGIKGNHIYYTAEGSCFPCVFSLENSRSELEFLTTTKFPSEKSQGFWFMPQLFS